MKMVQIQDQQINKKNQKGDTENDCSYKHGSE